MAESSGSRDSGWRDYAGWRSSGRDWGWSDGSRDSGPPWRQPLDRARSEFLPLYGLMLEHTKRRGGAEVAGRQEENARMKREEECRSGRSNPEAGPRFVESQVLRIIWKWSKTKMDAAVKLKDPEQQNFWNDFVDYWKQQGGAAKLTKRARVRSSNMTNTTKKMFKDITRFSKYKAAAGPPRRRFVFCISCNMFLCIYWISLDIFLIYF